MKRTRMACGVSIAAGVLASACPLSAQGIWFVQRATRVALIYGEGADDLDAVKRLPLVKSVSGYDADWTPVPTSLHVAGAIPVVHSEEAAVAVTADMDYGL